MQATVPQRHSLDGWLILRPFTEETRYSFSRLQILPSTADAMMKIGGGLRLVVIKPTTIIANNNGNDK